MSASKALAIRFSEIDATLRALKKIENQYRKNKRQSSDVSELIASSRASVYIMIYNSLESAMRMVFSSIRSKIKAEQLTFRQIGHFWCLDAIQAAFLEKMQAGTNHGNILVDITSCYNGIVSWEEAGLSRLPFSGNFGRGASLTLKTKLGMGWSAPPRTLGGDDLENIRERRNALAHGLESFREAGNKTTAGDLEQALGRINMYMISFTEALERYRDNRDYIV